MVAIRDKFRRRSLGKRGWAGGTDEEIPNTPVSRAENTQTQNNAVKDKVYSLGQRPPKRK